MRSSATPYSVIRDAKFVSIIIFLLGFILLLISYLHSTTYVEFWHELLKDFGSVLCSIGVISLVYELLIRRQLIDDYHDELRSILNPDAKFLGISAIFANRTEKMRRGYLIESLIRSAKTEMVCIGLSLYQFVEHGDLIKRKVLEDGCSFHFCIFDSESDTINALDRSLGRGVGSLPPYMARPTVRFTQLLAEIRASDVGEDKFSIRTYDFIPTFGIISIDRDYLDAKIIVELNGYDVEGSVCPGFELVRTPDGWFRFFYDQVNKFLSSGRLLSHTIVILAGMHVIVGTYLLV